jgi:hypothetical protein
LLDRPPAFAWNDVNRGQVFSRAPVRLSLRKQNPTAAVAAIVVGVLIMIWL